MDMLNDDCGCLETYQQPKLFDPHNVLIICLDCGEVVDEVGVQEPIEDAASGALSTESPE